MRPSHLSFRGGTIEQKENDVKLLEEKEKKTAEPTEPSKEEKSPIPTPKMPCLFNLPEELPYDRYAACLAATEGLRRARDVELSAMKKKGGFPFSKEKNQSEEEKRTDAKYVVNSGKVIRALGLTIPQFNQLGREVMQNPPLKERVMEQAYLYRMTATLSMPRTPLLKADESFLKTHRRHRVQMFASATMEIEELRKSQMEKLCRALKVDHLPKGLQLSDPRVLAILSPKIRAVCEAFPLQAEEIVRKHGLDSDEFNKMLETVKSDAVMRWKVNRHIKKSGKGKRS